MEMRYYIQLFLRRWWIIALLAVMTGATAYTFSRLQPTKYEATVQLIILSRPDFGQTQAARGLLHTYASRFQSTKRTQIVIDELQLDMTAESLLGAIKVGASTDSNIISVAVEHTDPQIAERIASSLAEEFERWRNDDNANYRQEDWIRAEVLDQPRAQRVGNPLINGIAGLVLGSILGIMLAFVLEALDARFIRNAHEAETLLDLPVVGAIPKTE